ncbi:hypothetical protein [Pseudomonas sp. RIT-To-2]
MQPKTEGMEEQGPGGVPFINDPDKPSSDHRLVEEPVESDEEDEEDEP